MSKASLHVFSQLFRRDFLKLKREFPNRFFDTCFLFFTNIVVFGYFMPESGLTDAYGPFLLIGAIASYGLFEVISKVGALITDIEGDRTISYTLTLPVRSHAIFCYIAIFWAINSMALSIFLFPIGKLLLFNRFDLTKISYAHLVLIYVTSNLFFGFFSLWLTSIISGVHGLSSIFMRFVNPLFMFGAYFYTWKASFALSPIIGYIGLLNPLVYVMEGMRSAALGQKGFIPYWICLLALWGFIFACGIHGIYRLKKRLDCV